jgi:hypothetical protein
MGSTISYYWDNQEKFDKIKTVSGGDDEEIFSQSLLHQQYKKNMSDREIMDAKHFEASMQLESLKLNTQNYLVNLNNIQKEMYEMFARKHLDYGLNNIALGGDLTVPEDKTFSLTGLAIRLTDKISRLKNLLINGKNFVKGEGMEDTFIDIVNYGIIGMLVGRDKWKK